MKRIVAFALVLCMLFTSCAFAEGAESYVPGTRTLELFGAAFGAGKIVTGDLTLHLDINPSLLSSDEDEAALLSSVLSALDYAHLTFGLGKLEKGLRLELGAALDSQSGGESASMDAAANLTWDNISLESNLLPGKRVTLKWETLLALMGVDENNINAFRYLHQYDPEALLQEAFQMINERFDEILNQVATATAPYLTIISGHVAKLDMQVETDVPAQDNYPAVTQQITTYISVQQIAAFISDMADQFEADGFFATSSTELEELRESIAELETKEGGFIVTVGLGEDGVPLFLVVDIDSAANDEIYILSIIYTPAGDSDDTRTFDVCALHSDAAGSEVDSFTLSCTLSGDSMGPQFKDSAEMKLTASAVSGGVVLFGLDYSMTMNRTTTDENLPGIAANVTYTQTIADPSGDVRSISTSETLSALTADGGESNSSSNSFDMYIGNDGPVKMTAQSASAFAPDGNGGVAGQSVVSMSMPALGFNAYDIGFTFTSKDYDPQTTDALEALSLEELTIEEMQSLQQVLLINAVQKILVMVANLPEPLSSMARSALGM